MKKPRFVSNFGYTILGFIAVFATAIIAVLLYT